MAMPSGGPAPYGAPAGYGAPGGYEFTPEQNQTISRLTSAMSFVGILFLILGCLAMFGGVAELVLVGSGGNSIITGIVYAVLGGYTKQAASSFDTIVSTQGNDIPHLMNALDQLRRLYGVLRVLIIVALVLLALVFVVGFIVTAAGAAAHAGHVR
jgi:O-antigen ligase